MAILSAQYTQSMNNFVDHQNNRPCSFASTSAAYRLLPRYNQDAITPHIKAFQKQEQFFTHLDVLPGLCNGLSGMWGYSMIIDDLYQVNKNSSYFFQMIRSFSGTQEGTTEEKKDWLKQIFNIQFSEAQINNIPPKHVTQQVTHLNLINKTNQKHHFNDYFCQKEWHKSINTFSKEIKLKAIYTKNTKDGSVWLDFAPGTLYGIGINGISLKNSIEKGGHIIGFYIHLSNRIVSVYDPNDFYGDDYYHCTAIGNDVGKILDYCVHKLFQRYASKNDAATIVIYTYQAHQNI